MKAAEQTLADAKTLLLSIESDWEQLARRSMSQLESKGVYMHMTWAMGELAGLFGQLESEGVGAK